MRTTTDPRVKEIVLLATNDRGRYEGNVQASSVLKSRDAYSKSLHFLGAAHAAAKVVNRRGGDAITAAEMLSAASEIASFFDSIAEDVRRNG